MDLPAVFYDKMKTLLGDEFEDFLASYDDERLYGLRINTQKISCEEFERICPFPVKKIPWIDNGYYYRGGDSPAKYPYYHAGLYYIQEPSAMTPASRLDIEEGDAVLDLCAAPGGKATELGAKLRGSGVLVANDISNSRAKALLKNIELFGIRTPFVVNEPPYVLADYFEGFFDKILLDAPCSGEGMFRKDPAVAKNYETTGTAYYAKLQREIVGPAVRMLKPGGKLLYSTCTFSPKEDEETVQFVLDCWPEMRLVEIEGYEGFAPGRPEWSDSKNPELAKCVRIWPHKMNGEGHFLALFEKVGEGFSDDCPGEMRSTPDKSLRKQLEFFYEFAKDLTWDFDERRLELQGSRLFYMPEKPGKLTGLRFLRNGLYLGDCLNKRFEPSQALAMAIRRGEYKNTVSFAADDVRVVKYLKGETVTLEDEDLVHDPVHGISSKKDLKGWQLVCVDGFPLGWAKAANMTLKNKYHAGWRLM